MFASKKEWENFTGIKNNMCLHLQIKLLYYLVYKRTRDLTIDNTL